MKILVVDDDSSIGKLLRLLLEKRNHQVTVCSNGEEACWAFQNNEYSLVFLDWEMTGMSGLEVCQAIRSHAKGGQTYIAMITGVQDKDCRDQVFEAGANDFISKPFSLTTLRSQLMAVERQANLIGEG